LDRIALFVVAINCHYDDCFRVGIKSVKTPVVGEVLGAKW
jgi:hypothetical protein